jgi:hypothetical protein
MMMLGESAEQARPAEVPAGPVDAIVLKLNERSARVRILGESGDMTLRSADVHRVLPGHIATVQLTKRWTYQGDAYASGAIKSARLDISALGLEPLPLEAQSDYDAEDLGEPFDDDADPYTALWRESTARPRPSFRMHPIAWEGREAWESDDDEAAPICDAADLYDEGHIAEARELVMSVLCDDLRCVDGHAHLGNWAFDLEPGTAKQHYEIGMGIGDLSLVSMPEDALLLWGPIYNRPYLRCLFGAALCDWRLGDLARAEARFERVLRLNPPDNQGARFCWHEVRQGGPWEDFASAER